jgi:hypothetical protein
MPQNYQKNTCKLYEGEAIESDNLTFLHDNP